MASREIWCAQILSKLSNDDDRIFTLNEIKDYFASVSQEEANEIANILQLPIVFDCLNDSKTEQIDLACDVLALCMSNLTIGESTNKYGTLLERALYHPSQNVKIMALRELYRTASNPNSISEINKHVSLISALVICVGEDDLAVAQKACEILILIGKTLDGIEHLISTKVKEDLKKTMAISDIVRFRIYEVIVEIGTKSSGTLHALLTTKIIQSLLTELDSDDPLLKLNVIELLTTLARTEHGFMYLHGNGLQKIITNMATMDEDPLSGLLLPGYLRFFGNIAYWRPNEIFSKYPFAINVVYNIISSQDLPVIGVALDTLGHIASSNDGKYVLQSTDENLLSTIKTIGAQLAILPTELRVRALNCIENLIRVAPDQQNNRVCSLVESWFKLLDSDPLALIVRYAENPFEETRCAGLNILQALAELFWGQQLIQSSPGLIEFLLDRRIETIKESKEIKYAIVKALSVSSVFSEAMLVRLQQYVKEGPFFVQAVTEIIIKIGTHSSGRVHALITTGILVSLESEVDSDDPLIKLNVIELLATLAQTKHGFLYLSAGYIISKIMTNISTIDKDALSGILLPGYLKFFSNVAYWSPEKMFSEYPIAINIVYNIIRTQYLTVIGVAFDTLGHVASTNDGKYALQSTGENLLVTLKSIGTQLAVLPTELRVRALHCIENLIRVAPDQQNSRICSLVESWFKILHSDPLALIVPYIEKSFIGRHCVGLNILQALANFLWGQQLIQNSPDLIEFLLDRKVESTKESKEIKHDIVKALSVSSVFSEAMLARLQLYVREEPFYHRKKFRSKCSLPIPTAEK